MPSEDQPDLLSVWEDIDVLRDEMSGLREHIKEELDTTAEVVGMVTEDFDEYRKWANRQFDMLQGTVELLMEKVESQRKEISRLSQVTMPLNVIGGPASVRIEHSKTVNIPQIQADL